MAVAVDIIKMMVVVSVLAIECSGWQQCWFAVLVVMMELVGSED